MDVLKWVFKNFWMSFLVDMRPLIMTQLQVIPHLWRTDTNLELAIHFHGVLRYAYVGKLVKYFQLDAHAPELWIHLYEISHICLLCAPVRIYS